MTSDFPAYQQCLSHQKPEDQMSPIGLVCAECKRRLYLAPPLGSVQTFWESQPGAFTLEHEPCFVFQLRWNDWSIRSLHPSDSPCDLRSMAAQRFAAVEADDEAADEREEWESSLDDLTAELPDDEKSADGETSADGFAGDEHGPTK